MFCLSLIFNLSKYGNFSLPKLLLLVGALAETALWLLPEGLAFVVGAKANVPFAGRHKIDSS